MSWNFRYKSYKAITIFITLMRYNWKTHLCHKWSMVCWENMEERRTKKCSLYVLSFPNTLSASSFMYSVFVSSLRRKYYVILSDISIPRLIKFFLFFYLGVTISLYNKQKERENSIDHLYGLENLSNRYFTFAYYIISPYY